MVQSLVKATGRKVPESFRLGLKNIYLPTHVLTLLRRDDQPPNWATFQVPLRFTKFDIRDYLWNLYRVEAKSVRSAIKQHVAERRHGTHGPWTRPPSTKFMTVEMTRPFVWPAVPQDKTPWNNQMWKARDRRSEEMQEEQRMRQLGKLKSPTTAVRSVERTTLREKAELLLKGKVKWSNDAKLDEKWDAAKESQTKKRGGQENAVKETGKGSETKA